jgi:hypothetical protein
VYGPNLYPLGGMGYTQDNLPTLTITSASGTGASVYVPSVLGKGTNLVPKTDRIGAISTISLTNPGEDYITTPNVSFRVQDILIANVFSSLPTKGTQVYQGTSVQTATYVGYYD